MMLVGVALISTVQAETWLDAESNPVQRSPDEPVVAECRVWSESDPLAAAVANRQHRLEIALGWRTIEPLPEPSLTAQFDAPLPLPGNSASPSSPVIPAAWSQPVLITRSLAGPRPIWDSAVQPAGFEVAPSGSPLFFQPQQDKPAGALSFLAAPEEQNPNVLRPPGGIAPPPEEIPKAIEMPPPGYLLRMPIDPPLGYTGRSGIVPRESQETSDFVPMEDRWRSGFPEWDRYDKGHPPLDDYPYVEGELLNPYTQNVYKGDYPIIGQHTFLNVTGEIQTIVQTRQVPTPANSFDTTAGPGEPDFFGNPRQFAAQQFYRATFELFHGDASFKPVDWRVQVQPVFNMNYLDVKELGIVSPDVTQGTTRFRTDFALEEWFVETKLADLSPQYDFMSLRVGSQPFVSDFRGFIFDDTNRGVRLFGTRLSNQEQFNVVFFDQQEKDTNSDLNTFDSRGQEVLIANYYHQDFIWPGYTTQVSFHYDHDSPSLHYDDNGFLVRPDPAGIAQPHAVDVCYLGWAGDGHINRVNVDHAFYWAFGNDSLNPMAGQPERINAEMAALELSYDVDWIRFRTSLFYATGDSNPIDDKAHGFDTILDDPNFAGGEFSYWQRQPIKLLGVNLKQANSLVPDLRASKAEGQANFVNPGLMLANFGMDFELTPKCKLISNVNLLWFDETAVLEQFVFQSGIHRHIGTDLSLGTEYRPWLNNNFIIRAGVSGLVPAQGFYDLYDPIVGHVGNLFASFVDMKLTY